jgi:hypothetical protein
VARFIFAISFVAVDFVAETIFGTLSRVNEQTLFPAIQKQAAGGNVMLAGFGLR